MGLFWNTFIVPPDYYDSPGQIRTAVPSFLPSHCRFGSYLWNVQRLVSLVSSTYAVSATRFDHCPESKTHLDDGAMIEKCGCQNLKRRFWFELTSTLCIRGYDCHRPFSLRERLCPHFQPIPLQQMYMVLRSAAALRFPDSR